MKLVRIYFEENCVHVKLPVQQLLARGKEVEQNQKMHSTERQDATVLLLYYFSMMMMMMYKYCTVRTCKGNAVAAFEPCTCVQFTSTVVLAPGSPKC